MNILRVVLVVLSLAAGLVLHAVPCLCQQERSAITGRVNEIETGRPIESANIFLGQTMLGTSSNREGRYRLDGIPPGIYQMIISCVGYEPVTMTVRLDSGEVVTRNVVLRPRPVSKEEVQVVGQDPVEWRRLLKQFTTAFLGSGANASLTRIENPEVINLWIDPDTDRLRASSDSTIRVENRSLGFQLNILLGDFQWNIREDVGTYRIYPKFQKLIPVDGEELAGWRANREKTFRGSLRHFLSSLIMGMAELEGFAIHTGPLMRLRQGATHLAEPGEVVVSRVYGSPFTQLAFKGWLRVEYGHGSRRIASFIDLTKDFVMVDQFGNLADPMGMEVMGDWSASRVSDLLPLYGE